MPRIGDGRSVECMIGRYEFALFEIPSRYGQFPTPTYFKPGMFFYGKTHDGAYMKQSEALGNGFKPAVVNKSM